MQNYYYRISWAQVYGCMYACAMRLRACETAHALDVRMYIIMSRLAKSDLKCF